LSKHTPISIKPAEITKEKEKKDLINSGSSINNIFMEIKQYATSRVNKKAKFVPVVSCYRYKFRVRSNPNKLSIQAFLQECAIKYPGEVISGVLNSEKKSTILSFLFFFICECL
jgi:hypothetical protein